jgi:hypothetical protein
MNTSFGLRPLFVLAALVPLLLAIQPTWLDAWTKGAKARCGNAQPSRQVEQSWVSMTNCMPCSPRV